MDPSKYLNWIKLSPRYLLPIFLFTGILVFAPNWLLQTFGMGDVVDRFRPYIGLVFLLSAVLLISSGLVSVVVLLAHQVLDRLLLKQSQRRLHVLSEDEKAVLRGYIRNQTRTMYLSPSDGVVGGLLAEDILFRSSNLGNTARMAYNIQPWAWVYLNEHSELLSEEAAS